MAGKKVVFVDDSATVLMSVDMACAELVAKGVIELKTYMNPVRFLDDVQSEKITFDLLVCDVNMPQMNGLDLIGEIKQIPSCRAKLAIALTTESSQDMKEMGKKVGLNGWLTKPFTDEKIVASICKILRL